MNWKLAHKRTLPRRLLHQTTENCLKFKKLKMKRLSILNGKTHLDLSKEVGYNVEKAPEFLCEHCGVILSTKQSLKHHMAIIYTHKSHYLPM